MKNIILLMFLCIILSAAEGLAQDSTKVTDFTADTSPAAAGAFYYIESSTDKHITWGTLTTAIRDSIEANDYTIAGTWSGMSNYVTIADAETITGKKIYTNALHGVKHLFPFTTDTYMNGWSTVRWLLMMARDMYAENFYVLDPNGSDSSDAATISYDGTNVTFDKPLNLTESFTMDSAATLDVLNFEPHSYTVSSVTDTIITLSTSDLFTLIELDLPGALLNGISKLQIDTATKGMELRFYNGDASFAMYFKDLISGDDNLNMDGDFTAMTQYDYIEFLCVDATKNSQIWMETGISNNN